MRIRRISIFLTAFFFASRTVLAVDVLDIFKFNRDAPVQLQTDVALYDPKLPYGVISPFTGYVGLAVAKLESVQNLSEIKEFKIPAVRNPGEIEVKYVNPKNIVEVKDKVMRRNYVGAFEIFVVPKDINTVFALATDYNHLANLLPGMQESKIVDMKANRIDVETWRTADVAVFGPRRSYYRTTNIMSMNADRSKRIIKSQLLLGDPKFTKQQGTMFMDSVWYFESCGDNCTRVSYLGFTLLRWDYKRTPSFFPFVANEVRKKMVTGIVEGGARSSLAVMIKFTDPRFKDKPLSALSRADKEAIEEEVERRFEQIKKSGHIQIDWDTVFK